MSLAFPFANSYARLPERFYARLKPAPVARPRLIQLNRELAEFLGLDAEALATPQGMEVLAGNRIPEGAEPLAIAYAGHQFGHFVPQLGDGRANLMGELPGQDGVLYDLQWKGSGPTPFSRRGDGRAALGPVLREYVVSEAMAALGVPTTRALSAVTTGETVFRETALPGGVLVRVAASHLRVGTFQYFAAQQDVEALRVLVGYAIERHYPEAREAKKPARALLAGVVGRHARLVAQWMLLGFVHGVMNTDNTSISGETLDYGPCAFLEAYHPAMRFSSIDQRGRYAYSNQPHAAHWNLARLAETLLPLLAEEEGGEEAAVEAAREVLAGFAAEFDGAHAAGLRRKLGLAGEREGDGALADDLLSRMAAHEADFTLTFRGLAEAAAGEDRVRELFADPAAYDGWAVEWRKRLALEPGTPEMRAEAMRRVNPRFIPRNHRVEAVIEAAVEREDFSPFKELLQVTARPFEDCAAFAAYAEPARPEERVTQTFCGT